MPARKKEALLNDEQMLALYESGEKKQDIAKITGLNRNTIAKRLKHLTPRKSTEIFKEHKADIFTEFQRKIAMKASADISNARNTKDYVTALGILHDKEQQLRGINPESRPMIIVNEIRIQPSCEQVDNPVDKSIIDISGS